MSENGAGMPSNSASNSRVNARCDHTKLLSDVLEAIVGGFLHSGDVLSEVESFPKLLQAMECILVHGMRIFKQDVSSFLFLVGDLTQFSELLASL